MRALILTGLLLSTAAFGDDDRCRHSEPRSLQLDFSGIRTVVFEIGPNDLRLTASPDADGLIQGRACASDADYLDRLTLTRERDGDKLIVLAEREGRIAGSLLRSNYARMYLSGSIPEEVAVELVVGSGDGRISGASEVKVTVGSGDAEINHISGPVTATVGSGDIEIRDIGELQVGSIGSGDVEARNVGGKVTVGSIGSGDFEFDGANGDVEIGSIGSGDADLNDIDGNVTVGTLGSGDVEARNIRGNLTVRTKGSGSVRHSNVDGNIDVPGRR